MERNLPARIPTPNIFPQGTQAIEAPNTVISIPKTAAERCRSHSLHQISIKSKETLEITP